MRPTALLAAAGLALGALVGVAAFGGGDGPGDDPVPAEDETVGPNDLAVSEAFFEAWWRSRTATYRVDATFVRTLPDGSTLPGDRTLVQRPPDVLVLQSGEVRGTVDGAYLRCTVDPEGNQRCTSAGTAADHRAVVRSELERFAGLLQGADPLYRLTDEGGCFVFQRRRAIEPAPYGDEARMCFDAPSGAMVRLRLERDGVVDEVVVTSIRTTVTDVDLATP
ncbi:MAG: hypothetical protein MUE34_00085 [Acidimicrobiales bacterium]|jgi:hypothetical protein|nr:hypothetical protein [Acidimicrobiales bacterium]